MGRATKISGTGSASTGAISNLIEQTLTASTTNITTAVSPRAGDLMTVRLTQDATGGRAITWASMFKLASTDIAGPATKVTVFQFVAGSDLNWYCTGVLRQL
jgi:hypothetical protein